MQEAADAAKSAMVSVIGLDSEKVQLLCYAANEDVDEANKVQIANFLCPVSFLEIFLSFFFFPFNILHIFLTWSTFYLG